MRIFARSSRERSLGLLAVVLLVGIPSGLAPFALPGNDPLFGGIWFATTAMVVLVHEALVQRDLRAALASWGTGGVLMVAAGAAVHEALRAFPPIAVSQAMLGALWLFGATTLGRLVARHVSERVGWRRTGVMTLGVGIATSGLLSPVVALLRPSTSVAVRLGWFLSEEDNAHFMGIARETLTFGPRAGELAEEVGTGFVSTSIVAMRVLRVGEGDPRLVAITVMTLSVALLIVLLGAALLLLQVSSARPVSQPTVPGLIMLGITSTAAATVGLAVAVTLPMQTGFLSFMWAMGWLAVAVSVTPLLQLADSVSDRVGLAAHVVASLLMLVSSWAFLIGGLIPLLIVVALVTWPWLWAVARGRWYVGPVVVAASGLMVFLMFQRSLFRHVLELGREALLIEASHIHYDALLFRVLVVVLIPATALALWRQTPEATRGVMPFLSSTVARTALIIGPTVGLGLSWVGLWIVTQLLSDGVIRYAGIKLAYGVVAMASLLLLSGAVGLLTREHAAAQLLFAGVLVLSITGSSTVAVADGWAKRISFDEQPHAVSVVQAIEQTSPDLPLRCLPRPGTNATPGARWAAYFCVRWVEDAFNQDRFHGHRFDFLDVEGPDFGPVLALARESGRYDFARIVPLERGWFGWDGN